MLRKEQDIVTLAKGLLELHGQYTYPGHKEEISDGDIKTAVATLVDRCVDPYTNAYTKGGVRQDDQKTKTRTNKIKKTKPNGTSKLKV